MIRAFRILLIVIFVMWGFDASAQFTLYKVETSDTRLVEIGDSVKLNRKKTTTYSNEFFNKAFWNAERKARRKERHTLNIQAGLGVTQTRFDNWANGGDNTFTIKTSFFLDHTYKVSRLSLKTVFDAAYGFNYIESKRFKNEDRFKLDFFTSWDISSKWSYSANATLASQFATSYKGRDDNTRISTLMSPGRLDLTIGFKYHYKIFTCNINPVGGNAIFVLDRDLRQLGLNGVEKGKASKWTVGPSIKMLLDTDFYKKKFHIRSEAYSYTSFKTAPILNWDTKLEIRATKFLSTVLEAKVYYNKEANAEKPKNLQYFSQMSLALVYKFANK